MVTNQDDVMTRDLGLPRPTWKLGEEALPATYPAAVLDSTEAMHDALAVKKGWERGRDITDFIVAAAGYHIEAARHAYVELAMMLRDGKAAAIDGWVPELRETSTPNVINAMLRREGEPGAIHVSISVRKVMTEEAGARFTELSKDIDRELEGRGIDPECRRIQRILGKGPITPSERVQDILTQDPSSYRGIKSGDELERVTVHAVQMDGIMQGLTSSDVQTLLSLEGDLKDDGYHCGRQIIMTPSMSYRMDKGFISQMPDRNTGGCAEILLPALSAMLRGNGLGSMVEDASGAVGKMPWTCVGGLEAALLEEAAHAAVYRQGGMFNDEILEAVKAFSRGLAQHDFNRLVPEFIELAGGLAAHDFTSADNRFDANDGRDDGYVARENGNLCLYNLTQNGEFRMELAFDLADGPDFVEFTEVNSGKPKLYARFAKTDEGWVQDYDGASTGRDPVPYHIENVKHFNYSICGFASLHCVLEDEHGLTREEETGPGC